MVRRRRDCELQASFEVTWSGRRLYPLHLHEDYCLGAGFFPAALGSFGKNDLHHSENQHRIVVAHSAVPHLKPVCRIPREGDPVDQCHQWDRSASRRALCVRHVRACDMRKSLITSMLTLFYYFTMLLCYCSLACMSCIL
jgi:hypothetical protein